MQKFNCPHCGKDFELSESITHRLKEEALQSIKKDYERKLAALTKQAQSEAMEVLSKKFDLEIKNAKKEAQEEKERSRKLIDEMNKLTDEIRALRRKDEERELEMRKSLAQKEDIIRTEAKKEEREKLSLDIAELKKKNEDMQKALNEARAKGEQKSQQLQGEVLELQLEARLRESFIYDEILPVGKGVQGADILQNVRNQIGKQAGTILWETKRAKWTPSWISKLKEDGRKNNATAIVLAMESPPQEIESFKVYDGVIVTSLKYCLPLAGILRRNLMLIAQAKSAAVSDEKLELLYQYIQSDAFRHRFEAFQDGIKTMEEDLLTERRSMERIWKKRETQLKRMQLNTSRMYGELQGAMNNKLKDINALSLDSG